MKQELSPRIAVAAVVALVAVVLWFGWHMATKPKQARIVFKNGNQMAAKERMRQIIDQSARTAPGSYTPPSNPGGQ
ncbi:MAG TPA: hypothetical protein VGS41_03990 [Chthonomonadales bacterium]|nr:hypothetical protein [Chthonomonadales bacterium]